MEKSYDTMKGVPCLLFRSNKRGNNVFENKNEKKKFSFETFWPDAFKFHIRRV